jgi:hypothetical protein
MQASEEENIISRSWTHRKGIYTLFGNIRNQGLMIPSKKYQNLILTAKES